MDSQFTKKTPWRSISFIAVLVTFSMIQFSIYFSSTYPFLLSLDPSVTENFYGLVVASYSFGQIIGSPLLGWYSHKVKNVRDPIAIGLVLAFFGNLTYASAILAPTSYAKYFVLIGRFVVGFGGSNVVIMRAFTSMSSSQKDRSRAIALINGGYALGMAVGPMIQLMFTPLGFPGPFYISIYTAPSFSSCIINVICLVCLWLFFEERYAGLVDTNTDDKKSTSVPKYDLLALLLCHLTVFTQRLTFTTLETLNSPLSMLMFGWNKTEVVRFIGLAHAMVSAIGLLVSIPYLLFKMEKILNFRLQCICAVFGLLVFHLLTFSYPFLPSHLHTYSQEDYDIAIANGTELSGCNTGRFNWCYNVRATDLYLYYGAYILFTGLCFPIITVTINILFSMVLGPVPISFQQGMLNFSGSLARISGPIAVSALYSAFGPQAAWSLEFIVLGTNLIAWIYLYKRMVPLKLPENGN